MQNNSLSLKIRHWKIRKLRTMAEHHLGAIDFELSKFKNKSRIEGYRAAYFKDDEHHSGSMTFVYRGPLEPVVYARYPYEEEMMFEDAKGVELWANKNCQASYVYYSPDEVEPATEKRVAGFFSA